jgi:ATP-dependent Clp endopeptidase proteolytic subunit ClpP
VTQEIFIYGEVGKQVTLDTVLAKITPKATEYIVYIHSPGGDVFEGFAIYNALKNTGKEIEVRIVGQCASIATSIASAASPGRLFMNEKGSFMIHNPSFMSISGESKDLRNAAELLDQIKSQFLKEWSSRTGLSSEQLSKMYDAETFLTPTQAKEMGFVDEVKEELKAVAKADFKKYQYMKDKNKIVAWANDFLAKVMGLSSEDLPKAEVTETLADGTVIKVQTEDGDWTGKQVTLEDGSPVPPGTYELSGGATFTVDESGLVTEKKDAEAEQKEEESPENDMKLKEENEALKAKIVELESALEARTTTEAKLQAKASELENKLNVQVKALSDELKKFKETTVGDQTPPAKAVNAPLANQPVTNDPLQKLFGQYIIDPRK